jgi:hypothetical protein
MITGLDGSRHIEQCLIVKSSPASIWARIGIGVGATVALMLSFHTDILRNGNEPMAGFLALFGLFAVGIAFRLRREDPATDKVERRGVAVLLEYLSIAAAFGLGWIWLERDSFFAEGPSGGNLFWLDASLLIAQGAIFVCAIFIRRSIRGIRSRFRLNGQAWTAMGAAAVLLICLNLETHAQVIYVEGQGKVILETQGFPMAAKHRVRVERLAPHTSMDGGSEEIVGMPNGGRVTRTESKTLVTRFGRTTESPRSDDARFRDGTEVRFDRTEFFFNVPHVAPVKVNFKNQRAEFIMGRHSYRDWIATTSDSLLAFLLVAHTGWVAAVLSQRRRRVGLAC